MKLRYYILTGITAYFLFLFTDIPAVNVLALVPENAPVRLSNVSGSIWSGRADEIVLDRTHRLTDASWSFRPLRLLTGKAAVSIESLYRGNPLTATVSASALGTIGVDDLVYNAEAGIISELASLPVGELAGNIRLQIDSARWARGTVPSVSGKAEWRGAAITIAETAQLGNVDVILGENDEAPLTARISNEGGQIDLDGNVTVDEQGSFELDIQLDPLPTASRNISNSIAMFARRKPDGSYTFTQKGNLQQFGLM